MLLELYYKQIIETGLPEVFQKRKNYININTKDEIQLVYDLS